MLFPFQHTGRHTGCYPQVYNPQGGIPGVYTLPRVLRGIPWCIYPVYASLGVFVGGTHPVYVSLCVYRGVPYGSLPVCVPGCTPLGETSAQRDLYASQRPVSLLGRVMPPKDPFHCWVRKRPPGWERASLGGKEPPWVGRVSLGGKEPWVGKGASWVGKRCLLGGEEVPPGGEKVFLSGEKASLGGNTPLWVGNMSPWYPSWYTPPCFPRVYIRALQPPSVYGVHDKPHDVVEGERCFTLLFTEAKRGGLPGWERGSLPFRKYPPSREKQEGFGKETRYRESLRTRNSRIPQPLRYCPSAPLKVTTRLFTPIGTVRNLLVSKGI